MKIFKITWSPDTSCPCLFFTAPPVAPNSNSDICKVVQMLKKEMEKDCCCLYNGRVRRKVPFGKYTYADYKTVKEYILNQMAKPHLADAITPRWKELINLLSEPECGLIASIQIDYNYNYNYKFSQMVCASISGISDIRHTILINIKYMYF